MGTAIINAIKDGLGLIEDLASQFLSGFTALFWDATANSGAGGLTVFGSFALVMLGVAITMGCIKLCLNVVRGNTGA